MLRKIGAARLAAGGWWRTFFRPRLIARSNGTKSNGKSRESDRLQRMKSKYFRIAELVISMNEGVKSCPKSKSNGLVA